MHWRFLLGVLNDTEGPRVYAYKLCEHVRPSAGRAESRGTEFVSDLRGSGAETTISFKWATRTRKAEGRNSRVKGCFRASVVPRFKRPPVTSRAVSCCVMMRHTLLYIHVNLRGSCLKSESKFYFRLQ
jgi:hypothetical protein